MLYLKWVFFCLLDIILLPVWYIGAIFLSLFTHPMADGYNLKWGGWFGTYDNPPQGDKQWITEKSPFPYTTHGWRGYVNRVGWLWRNPAYGFQKAISVPKSGKVVIKGNPDISDKYRRAGWYFATMGKEAWEFYCVIPYKWKPDKCLRVRIGWKIATDKLTLLGFAPFVNSIHPFKSYG